MGNAIVIFVRALDNNFDTVLLVTSSGRLTAASFVVGGWLVNCYSYPIAAMLVPLHCLYAICAVVQQISTFLAIETHGNFSHIVRRPLGVVLVKTTWTVM